jgi:xanthine/uracil/vitamin C permease (AzgA family)
MPAWYSPGAMIKRIFRLREHGTTATCLAAAAAGAAVPWATALWAVFVSGVLFLGLLGYFVFVRSRI